MSLAENLLNSLDETTYENMRIAGSGEEEHIIVGQDRSITVPNALKTIAVKGDKDVETATIDCVRYWDGNDLSTFAIYLNYILPNGDEGTYIPKSITKSVDFFTFDWKIGSEFTYSQGKLTFWIVAKLTDNSGTLVRQWSSFQNSDCTIAQGGDKIYVPEKQTDQDVISQAISISRASAETAEQQANLAKEAAEKAATDAREAAEDEVSRIIGELGVVQELGDSPNSVVSQAKVTKEFFNVNERVDRNSKEIENIKYGIPPEEFETDNSVAYQKYVPANALPYAEIHKIGGMTYKSKNLLNLKDTEYKSKGITATAKDQTISFSGVATEQTWNILGSITLTAGDYALSCAQTIATGVNFYIYYSSDKFVSIGKEAPTITLTVTETSTFSVCVQITDLVNDGSTLGSYNLMLNPGSTDQPYEPYFEGLRSAKVTEIKSVGVNLFDVSTAIASNGTISVDRDSINWNYGATSGDAFAFSCWVDVTPNTEYYLKWNSTSISTVYVYTDRLLGTLVATTSGGYSFNVGNNKRLLFAFYSSETMRSGSSETISNIMLNKGSTALPYTPYVEHILPIPEAVQALDGWGQGIPDTDCYNFVDWRPEYGVKKYVRKTQRIVFDGTELWKSSNTDSDAKRFILEGKISSPKIPNYDIADAICNLYSIVSAEQTWFHVEGIAPQGAAVWVYDSKFTTAQEFVAYLAERYQSGNPVVLEYKLATPIETDISDLITADNLIGVEGGGVITFENEYSYDVPSEVEYQLEV